MDKNESTRTSNMRSPSVPNVQKPVKRGVRHAVETVGFNATTARDIVS